MGQEWTYSATNWKMKMKMVLKMVLVPQNGTATNKSVANNAICAQGGLANVAINSRVHIACADAITTRVSISNNAICTQVGIANVAIYNRVYIG